MSFVKYRLKEVAADFGVAPKEIADIISKFYEKPKSNTQVLNDQELNVVFDYMTQKNQIKSLEQVFAAKPTAPKAAPKAEAPKAESIVNNNVEPAKE
jgi:translation initiation factor IF-2